MAAGNSEEPCDSLYKEAIECAVKVRSIETETMRGNTKLHCKLRGTNKCLFIYLLGFIAHIHACTNLNIDNICKKLQEVS